MDASYRSPERTVTKEYSARRFFLKDSVIKSSKALHESAGHRPAFQHATIRTVHSDSSPEDNAAHLSPRSPLQPTATLQSSPILNKRSKRTEQSWEGPGSPRPASRGSQGKGSVKANSRPRNRTLEDIPWDKSSPMVSPKARPRIRSMHTSDPSMFFGAGSWSAAMKDDSPEVPPLIPHLPEAITSPPERVQSPKSPTGSRRRQVKMPTQIEALSRQTDMVGGSLPFPVRISNAHGILQLMETTRGNMYGDVEVRLDDEENWSSTFCSIDEGSGALSHDTSIARVSPRLLIPDLRCCQVQLVSAVGDQPGYLVLSPQEVSVKIYLRPYSAPELDQWLAALLCWQSIQPTTARSKMALSPQSSFILERRSGDHRRSSDVTLLKDSAIVKVGKVMLLHGGGFSVPRLMNARRGSVPLNGNVQQQSWQRVSGILRENGEFKLVNDRDVTLVSIVQLSQLSRFAVQRLEQCVLGKEFCIAMYPRYTATSTALSLVQPIYLSFESSVLFEVWLVLLRAFTIPELYGPKIPDRDEASHGAHEADVGSTADLFRVERLLSVRIIEARLRPPRPRTMPESSSRLRSTRKDPSIASYLAEVILDGQIRARTALKFDTNNPFWREDFDFPDLPGAPMKMSILLKKWPAAASSGALSTIVGVPSSPLLPLSSQFDSDPLGCHGRIEFDFDSLCHGADDERWWPIQDEIQEPIGEMLLKVRSEELVVLMAHEYLALSDILHNHANIVSVQVAQALPLKLERLSEVFLNIYQVSGHVKSWLMSLIQDEIGTAPTPVPSIGSRYRRRLGSSGDKGPSDEPDTTTRDRARPVSVVTNLLFRGNTLLTKSLELHMKRLGKVYLEETLSVCLDQIDDSNDDCEVDPNRLAPEADLEANWRNLVRFFRNVWSSIHSSLSRCPKEIRAVLRHVRTCAENRWGKFRSTVSYSSVSGFLFLRFFCPAVLNPKLFGLLKDHPQPRTQRALTLVAKSLQGLANMSTFGAKESWMEPMNHFLSSRRQEFKDFIDSICAVDTEPQSPSPSTPSSYITPTAVLARLPPTARESFPSLPYLIDQPRNFALLVNLWLDTVGSQGADLMHGEVLAFHMQCVALRQRARDCLASAEQANWPGHALPPRLDHLAERMDGWPRTDEGFAEDTPGGSSVTLRDPTATPDGNSSPAQSSEPRRKGSDGGPELWHTGATEPLSPALGPKEATRQKFSVFRKRTKC